MFFGVIDFLLNLSISLRTRNHKHYLTIAFSGINKDGLGRFRTEADNPEFQTCYFNLPNDEQIYNKFVSKRINSAEDNENLHFEIIKVKSRTNKNVKFDATDELSNLNKNDTVTNRSDKKRTRPVFDIGNGADNTVYGSGTKANELSIVSSEQSYTRSRKRIRPGFLP